MLDASATSCEGGCNYTWCGTGCGGARKAALNAVAILWSAFARMYRVCLRAFLATPCTCRTVVCQGGATYTSTSMSRVTAPSTGPGGDIIVPATSTTACEQAVVAGCKYLGGMAAGNGAPSLFAAPQACVIGSCCHAIPRASRPAPALSNDFCHASP